MANDSWATPQRVFDRIVEVIGLEPGLDVAATRENTKAPLYISEKSNGLSRDWSMGGGNNVAWCNPPYSNPAPWCAYASEQARTKNMFIVGLLPDDRSTKWYQEHIEGEASICWVPNKRISFVNPETGLLQGGNPKGSVIPLWTPWRTGRTEYVRFTL